jgi:hypothetical protein
MLIFSGDPGTKNFAASFTLVENNKVRLLATGMLQNTLGDLTGNVEEACLKFVAEIDALYCKYGTPDITCFERFQSRGNGGTLIECVNMMLGILTYRNVGLNPKVITAATWKNRLNAELAMIGQSLNDLYTDNNLASKHSNKTMHELDASFIGLYRMYDWYGIPAFSGFAGGALRYVGSFMDSPKL